jgi:hypothetical protein
MESPVAPEGFDVGVDAAVRWDATGAPEVALGVAIDGLKGPTKRLRVRTRILNESRDVILDEERPMTLRTKDATDAVRFARSLAADTKGTAVRLVDGALLQVDVAVRDLESGLAGSGRRVVAVAMPSKERVVVTPPAFFEKLGDDLVPGSSFPGKSSALLRFQVAGVRATGLRRSVEIVTRFFRDGALVREDPSGRIDATLPDPFSIDARIDFADLAAGDYEVRLEVRDVAAERSGSAATELRIRAP